MRIVGIVGSPRKGGNTEAAVSAALEAARRQGASVEMVLLAGRRIADCNNCGTCPKEPCPIEDDVPGILTEMQKADGIIIGSPVYFGDVTGLLKCLLDRCVCLKRSGMLLADKVAGAVAVGGAWGHSRALETIQHFCCGQGMIPASVHLVPGMGVQIFAKRKGELQEGSEELAKAKHLGDRVVKLLSALRRGPDGLMKGNLQ